MLISEVITLPINLFKYGINMGVQNRVKNGRVFEQSLIKDGWVVKCKSPRLKWIGTGKSIIQKIKNCGFRPELLKLDESSNMCKYDIINSETGKFREVKKYLKEDLTKWTLYSEPYFKISTRGQLTQISVEDYNKFVSDFFDLNSTLGLFEKVVENMTSCSEGIVVEDGFIPSDELEFRTVLVKNHWGGYHRITVQFRIKTK